MERFWRVDSEKVLIDHAQLGLAGLPNEESTCRCSWNIVVWPFYWKVVKSTFQNLNECKVSHVTNLFSSSSKMAFVCGTCGKQLTSSYNLKRHQSSVHDPSKNDECQSCQKKFSRNDDLKMHRKVCKQEKVCGFCSSIFENEAALYQHVTSIHGDGKFTCNTCH